MFRDFQMAVICKIRQEFQLLYVPLQADLQRSLSESWYRQWLDFSGDIDTVEFDPGYNPEAHERFQLAGYELPAPLINETRQSIHNLDLVDFTEIEPMTIKGVVAYVLHDENEELILFQNSNRSHIIEPSRFLFFDRDMYTNAERPALTLGSHLSAVYDLAETNLLFNSFRITNTFLPLVDYYQEASEESIREVLGHERLLPEDVDALAVNSNQWLRKRFAMLGDSGILNEFTPRQIASHANGYGLEITIQQNKIVFPADKSAAKRLLQFLNEEIYKGPITDTLYETNSKREAD